MVLKRRYHLWHGINVGGGGALSETVLWTNTSPTSSFSNLTIDLDSSLDNGYKYIKIVYRVSTTNSKEYEILIDAQAFLSNGSLTAAGNYTGCIGTMKPSGSSYVLMDRGFRKPSTSDTGMIFSHCYVLGATTLDDNYTIPTKIIGLK